MRVKFDMSSAILLEVEFFITDVDLSLYLIMHFYEYRIW